MWYAFVIEKMDAIYVALVLEAGSAQIGLEYHSVIFTTSFFASGYFQQRPITVGRWSRRVSNSAFKFFSISCMQLRQSLTAVYTSFAMCGQYAWRCVVSYMLHYARVANSER